MYQFDLNEGETILYVKDNVRLKKVNDVIFISIVVTNQRLLLFQNVNKMSNFHQVMSSVKGIYYPTSNEILFETSLNDITGVVQEEYVKVMFLGNRYLLIDDMDLMEVLRKE